MIDQIQAYVSGARGIGDINSGIPLYDFACRKIRSIEENQIVATRI